MINVISKTQRCFFLRERIHSKIKCTNNSTLVKPELFVNQNSKMPTLKRQDNSFTISFFGAVFCVDKRTQVFFLYLFSFPEFHVLSHIYFKLGISFSFKQQKSNSLFVLQPENTHTQTHTKR